MAEKLKGIEVGLRVHALFKAEYYPAEVVSVSTRKSRSKAPVKVHFRGYPDSDDTWVSVESLKNKKLGLKTFAECQDECPTISGNAFKRGEMHIPCITSFDMNHQLLAWMTEKYGSVESFVWIGHKTNNNGDDGAWVGDDSSVDYQKKESKCQEFQDDQYKGDFINRNGCAFNGNLQKPKCEGSEFDKAKGCAVLVYAKAGPTGASALNVPNGEVTSYEMLHGNWVKSADCEFLDVPAFGPRKTVECICQKIV